MARMSVLINGKPVVLSEHGYFVVDGNKVVGYHMLPGIDYADFNGWVLTDRGVRLSWDGPALRRRIRNFLRGDR